MTNLIFSLLAWLPERPILGRNKNLIGSPCLFSTISLCKWQKPINISLNICGKKAHLFLDNVRGKRPLCSGANSISGGTFSEKAFLAGTQYFRSEKKKLEIINIKWQLDYILSWGQNDTKKTYHMACTRNKQ